MRIATKQIEGFNYETGKPLSMTAPEWRKIVENQNQAGSWKVTEKGETFLYKHEMFNIPRIVIEIYGYI